MANEKERQTETDIARDKNQEPYQTVVKDLTEVICRFLKDGTLTFVNDVYCRFFGKSVEEFIGKKWQSYALSEDVSQIEAQLKCLSPSNTLVVIENRVSSASGQIRWMQFVNRGSFDTKGQLTEVQAVGRDITDRKDIEDKFQNTSNYLRQLIEVSPDALVTVSMEGKVMDVNSGTCHATGRSREHLIGTDFAEYFTEPDRARAGYMKAFTHGKVLDYPLTFRHASGECVDVLYNATVYYDDRGNVAGIFASARDITQWKKAEEALRRSQTELEAIYENAPIMMCVLDASRQVLYANKAFAEFVGRTVEEIKKERACGVIGCFRSFDDPAGCGHGPHCAACVVRIAMENALATGRSHHGIEYRTTILHNGDPRESVFLASVARIEISKQPNLLLCLEDITERQRIEEELRHSEERYRLLVDTCLDAVFLTAPDGRTFSANSAACRMFGLSEQELIQVGRNGIMDASDGRLSSAMEERDRTGRFNGELTFVRGDGSKFPGEISSVVFQDNRGEVRSSVMIRDISERRQSEAELRSSREQLRALATYLQSAREEERSRIAREIHDVLTQDLIRLKIDLAWLERRLSNPEIADDLKTLVLKVSGMKRMADASIECVQNLATELRPAVLDSLGLCGAVDWQIRDFQSHTGIDCHAEVPEMEIAVDQDAATAAFRILQESLTNIHRHAGASQVDVVLNTESGQVVLIIRDNGCGIPPERMEDPLSFGLSGMRERALLQRGTLEIRSLPGSGTTIVVRIPLNKKPPQDRSS